MCCLPTGKEEAMKKVATLTGMALATALGCSTFALADTYVQTEIPGIDVTAQRFRENAPIAISGTVAAKDGNDLILRRSDGDLRARILETDHSALASYARMHAGTV